MYAALNVTFPLQFRVVYDKMYIKKCVNISVSGVDIIKASKEILKMPPKPKYTRDQILDAALELVREQGIDALTSRRLGERLGCSVCPIFTVFKDMEELNTALRQRAWACFEDYMKVANDYNPAFKKRGMQWVKFAREQSRLFCWLFMRETGREASFDEVLSLIPFGKQKDIDIIMRDYRATRPQAEHLFRQMWTYTYGLCALCATGVCVFSEGEISMRLGEVFNGMIYVLQSGNTDAISILPAELGSADSAIIQRGHPDLSRGN